jgi:predicted  nucleic acid-binding Zn-ribbon protein
MIWEYIVTAVISLVSGGTITGLYLRKQTEGSATAGVVKESMEALKSALETLTSQQNVFAVTLKSKDDEIVALKDQIKELNLRVAENERKLAGMQRTIENEIRLRKEAEGNICFVSDCEMRKPKLGTYKPK